MGLVQHANKASMFLEWLGSGTSKPPILEACREWWLNKPPPQKAAPSCLTQSQKVFMRNASLDKAKSQGQQAGGSVLPALNRSKPGLVESLQRRMGCGLEALRKLSGYTVLCLCQPVMQKKGLRLYILQEI